MKTISLTICVLLLMSGLALAIDPFVSDDDTILAKDLGIRKYTFEATPDADKLMVVRGERLLDNQLQETWQSITYSPGKTHRASILIINRSFFSDANADGESHCVYQIAGVFKDRLENATPQSYGGGGKPGVVEAVFKTPQGLVKYVFSVSVEDFAKVKERVSNLPSTEPPTSGWTVATDHRER